MEIICTICLESMEHGRILATTCGHIFHEKCIVNWTTRSYRCPECRNEPTIPMRVIHLTWQEQIDSQEKQSLDSAEQAGSSESDLPKKSSSAVSNAMFADEGYSSQNTVEMEEVQTSPPNSPKAKEAAPNQRSDGCDVCNRYHFLLEQVTKLRNIVQEHENQAGSASPTPSKKLSECSEPEIKRKRSH
uniref:RING-type domain-containing protein n=1 Tax=Anopheles funestus TaxID=62324 RepID=A0A182S0G5_ANOFN